MNRDYEVFLKFEKWLSKIQYKPNWTLETYFMSQPFTSYANLLTTAFVEVPISFGGLLPRVDIQEVKSAQIIPFERLASPEGKLHEEFLGFLVKAEITTVEFAIRDKWLNIPELVV